MKTRELEMERRTYRGVSALVPPSMESEGFVVAFTERSGGVSSGIYESLNLGLRSGDDPELAKENRRRVGDSIGVGPFACGQQVHGVRLQRVGPDEAGSGYMDPSASFRGTDGLLTDEPGVALGVLTADCVPVVLADPATGRLAVIHAGWRGIAAGIVTEALRAFVVSPDLLAAIGPAIGPDHYEVGEDVARAVVSACSSTAVVRSEGSRLLLDLPAAVATILEARGIEKLSRAGACTACEEDRFFSYRRDGRSGRQGVVAMRAG